MKINKYKSTTHGTKFTQTLLAIMYLQAVNPHLTAISTQLCQFCSFILILCSRHHWVVFDQASFLQVAAVGLGSL